MSSQMAVIPFIRVLLSLSSGSSISKVNFSPYRYFSGHSTYLVTEGSSRNAQLLYTTSLQVSFETSAW